MQNYNNQPIGVFDSGVGGLTVWRELARQLPHESIIYYADSQRSPYGEKSYETIQQYCKEITEFLIEKGCKLIVVACNTATSAAISYLRTIFDVPFIGIEPAIKPAALQSITKHIGVLATKGTLEGRLFNETSKKHTEGVEVHIQIGTGLVPLVEENNYESDEAIHLLKKYTAPMVAANIDYLVLGCTHYPFYKDILKSLLPSYVKIVDPAPAVARYTDFILQHHHLLASPNQKIFHHFYTSGKAANFLFLIKIVTKKSFLVFEK